MIKDRTIIILENVKMGTYSFENINQILDNKPVQTEYREKTNLPESEIQKYIGTYLDEKDGHLFYNTEKIKWDMRFFPVSANEFSGVRQGGVDGVLRFTKLENGKVKLEMLQYGEVIGTGVRND